MVNSSVPYDPLIVELLDDKLVLSFDDARSRTLVRDYCQSFLKNKFTNPVRDNSMTKVQFDDLIEEILDGIGNELKEGQLHIALTPQAKRR